MEWHEEQAAAASYHGRRAHQERRAAAGTWDQRVRQAHLGLALQHELAAARPRQRSRDDYGLSSVIGNSLRLAIGSSSEPVTFSGLPIRQD